MDECGRVGIHQVAVGVPQQDALLDGAQDGTHPATVEPDEIGRE
jgi:hypothetical protein